MSMGQGLKAGSAPLHQPNPPLGTRKLTWLSHVKGRLFTVLLQSLYRSYSQGHIHCYEFYITSIYDRNSKAWFRLPASASTNQIFTSYGCFCSECFVEHSSTVVNLWRQHLYPIRRKYEPGFILFTTNVHCIQWDALVSLAWAKLIQGVKLHPHNLIWI